MTVEHITPDNFDAIVKQGDKPVLIDFWAPWCGPCQMMGPVFEDLSGDYEERMVFAKLNTEDHPELAAEFGIQGIPTLIMMKDGQEVGKLVGFAPKEQLKAKIDDMSSKL